MEYWGIGDDWDLFIPLPGNTTVQEKLIWNTWWKYLALVFHFYQMIEWYFINEWHLSLIIQMIWKFPALTRQIYFSLQIFS